MMLQTHGVWRTFGGVAAVAGVDFAVERGELRCLIGANGAGKSTFFKMLSGQLKPSRGEIFIDGVNVTGAPPFKIARIGVATKTQIPNLFDGLSVRENLELAALRKLQRTAAETAADDIMQELGLTALAQQPAGILAHGQRQILELGVVLIGRPQLILLDEPAAGMTPPEVEHMITLLDRMRGKHTIVLVEHDMQFIGRIAALVTVFHRGRVLAEDTMDNILRNPAVREAYLGKSREK